MHASCRSIALAAAVLTAAWAVAQPPSPAPEEPVHEESSPPSPAPGEITLRQAAALALVRHPALASYSWDVRAAEARILQAGLRPNPELSLEIEDLRWKEAPSTTTRTWAFGAEGLGFERERESGESPGLGTAETTIALSQVIELGGKRMKRVRLAETERALAQWDYEAARVEVLGGVAGAFVALLGAQERLRLQEELAELALQAQETAAARVEAGKASPLELTRAETELAAVEIARAAAQHDVAAARIRLAASYGAETPEFERAAGTLEDAAAPPSLETLLAAVERNPDLARWADEMAQRRAVLALEQAQRTPDIEVGAGFRTQGVDDTDVEAWEAGLSPDALSFGFRRGHAEVSPDRVNSLVLAAAVPLPVFNRNQGAIREAEHRVEQTSARRQDAELRVRSALRAAHEELLRAAETARRIRADILPRAQDAFERTEEGYREGKFGYLDVLFAQRTLFDVRQQYTESLIDYHAALADVERLTGQPLSELGEHLTAPGPVKGESEDE